MTETRISLQDLVDRFHLSPDQLGKKVSEEYDMALSKIIGDHEILGPLLGLTDQEMIEVDRDARTHEGRKKAMLVKWRQIYAFKATFEILIKAFLQCDRAQGAEEVCKLLAQGKFSWSCE